MSVRRGGKPLHYRMKGRNHKKDYKRFCLAQREAGLVNTSSGHWVEPGTSGTRDRGSSIRAGLNLW